MVYIKVKRMTEETKKPYQNVTVKKGKNSTVEIKGEVTVETLEAHRKKVFEEVRKDFAMPGFRKGHVPDEKVMEHVDKKHLLEEAADSALNHVYPLIIEEHEIQPITSPNITVTKLAFGSPLAFTARVGILPEIKLPDYKKIVKGVAKEKNVAEVSEKDVDAVIQQIREMHASHVASAETTEDIKESEPAEKKISEFPEFNDEFVKMLGDFQNVADFREKLKENLKKEKEHEATRIHRETLAKTLEEKIFFTIPEPLIEREVATILERLEEQLKTNELSKEDYFKKVGKTEEDFLKEQRDYIARQFKTKFILREIGKQENLHPDEKEIAVEARELATRYPNIDPVRLYQYAEEMLSNEKVLQFLEESGREEK